MTRPKGLAGPVVVDVRGQDVWTGPDGEGRVVERLAVTLEVDQRTGEIVAAQEAEASAPLGGLVGMSVRTGFGRALDAAFPEDAARRTLAYSVLSDLGGAVLVSGYSLLRDGGLPATPDRGEAQARAQADICIGWATGSPLLESLRRDGRSAIPYGPGAPVIDGDDPLGWHRMAAMAPGTVRRRRRLDVAPGGAGAAGEALVASSHFRDSHHAGDDDGGETVMHEYVVHAGVGRDGRLARVEVDPRVLPWHECPGAVASAQRLVGVAVDEVPARSRRHLTGPTTCTHLTSTMRCLADVPALAPLALRPG
jgi:hypothetical protein